MRLSRDSLALLSYIGGKGRMADTLAQMIPQNCTRYLEPYCGSAALALNCRKFDVKILNDWNANIANFWAVATSPDTARELLLALQATTYSYAEFQKAKVRRERYGANRADLIQWAADTYLLNWQSFNGLGDCWRQKSPDGYAEKLHSALGVPFVFRQLSRSGQRYDVYNRGAVELMDEKGLLSDPGTFIFLDPPYLEGLRSDGKLYAVDMPDVRDHIRLLRAIREASAKIIISGYWSGRDDGTDLYDGYLLPYGWHRHLLGEFSKSCESGTDEKSKGAEWVWCNYELEAEAPSALGFLDSYNDDEKSPCLREWMALQSRSKRGERVV